MAELKEVNVRLKLEEGDSLFSSEAITNPQKAVKLIKQMMDSLDREEVIVVNLDSQFRPLNYNVVAIGDTDHCNVNIGNVFKSAILSNASKLLMFHNHPSGSLSPSADDDQITKAIAGAGYLLGIPLQDHIIIAPNTNNIYSYKHDRPIIVDYPSNYVNDSIRQAVAEVRTEYDIDENKEEEKQKDTVNLKPVSKGIHTASEIKDAYRKEIADAFLKVLNEENPEESLKWIREWTVRPKPFNYVSNAKYRGLNSLFLNIVCEEKGYKDPRFLTWNQISKIKGAHVRKGEEATRIFYWQSRDTTKNPREKGWLISFDEQARLIREEGRSDDEFYPVAYAHDVFNAEQCEGLKHWIEPERNNDVAQDEYVDRIIENMNIPLISEGESCFYRPSTDEIHMPPKETFSSSYAYNSTLLHELTHASGSEKRLNRDIENTFGDPNYAFEELIAEMGSALAAVSIGRQENDEEAMKKHLENHKAYVKSWGEYITNDPSVVEKALYQAQLATDYLDANGGVISIEEFNRLHKKDRLELYEDDGKINVYHISNEKDLSEQTVSSLDWLNEEKEEEHQSFSQQRM